MNKKYNQGLRDADDLRTKKCVADFLTTHLGWELRTPLEDQPEVYKAWDFQIFTKEGKLANIEVEYVYTWRDQGRRPPRWPNMSVPFRKAESKAVAIFRANHYLDTICFTTLTNVKNSPVIYKNTTNSRSGEVTKAEPFFALPHSKLMLATTIGGSWNLTDEHGNQKN